MTLIAEIVQRMVIWAVGVLLDRGKADAIIRECRHSHVTWSRWATRNPDAEALKVAGDKAHHDRWIHNYDHVLRVLRRFS